MAMILHQVVDFPSFGFDLFILLILLFKINKHTCWFHIYVVYLFQKYMI